jgi:hypothetical protein
MPFQIVRLELSESGEVIARRPLQPVFELRDDASALAEFDAGRCEGECGYDAERDCWWARDSQGRTFRFVVEQAEVEGDIAA